MRFFVFSIFDGVIMDGHPIFWEVDAGVAGIHHDKNIWCPSIMTPSKMENKKQKSHLLFSFLVRIVLLLHLSGDLFVKNIITSFHWFHLNNYTPYENKCFNPRNQIHRVAFVKSVNRINASRDTRCSRALNTHTKYSEFRLWVQFPLRVCKPHDYFHRP